MTATRRDFAKTLAIAASVLPLTVKAQAPAVPSAFGSALSEVVRSSYRQHLDEADLARIDKDLQDYASTIERLRKFPLANADEPDFTFASLVERWP